MVSRVALLLLVVVVVTYGDVNNRVKRCYNGICHGPIRTPVYGPVVLPPPPCCTQYHYNHFHHHKGYPCRECPLPCCANIQGYTYPGDNCVICLDMTPIAQNPFSNMNREEKEN